MILSDDKVLHAWDDDPTWFQPKFKTSHLEANARIKELEAHSQDWHERYVICCEDSRLEKEALRNELIEANAKLRELAEAAEWRDECNDLFTDMNIDWINGRPEGPHIDSIYEISEEAEIAYEKALAAAKEG